MNLRDLVRTQKGNRTFNQLAIDCGGYPSDKRLQQLATQKQKNFADPETIQALARGLRVSELTVVLASAEDLGLDVDRALPRILDYLPPGVNDLEEEQLFAIANLIRSFIPPAQQDIPTEAEVALAKEVIHRIPARPDISFAGPEPSDLRLAADDPGEPSEGQLRRDEQDEQAES